MNDKIDWHPEEMPRLWCYNLHYFDYLQSTELTNSLKIRLMLDWIKQNPIETVTAWEPYTVSLRIVNWVKFLDILRQKQNIPEPIVESLSLQSCWLFHNLELHILANHLFKNIKALMFSGMFLEGVAARNWGRLAEKMLLQQIDEQLLADGGHYERSPMYHCIFLEDLLDIFNAGCTEYYGPIIGRRVSDAAYNSALFLRDIRLTDERIPLFNDSAFSIAPDANLLLEYASEVLQIDFDNYELHPKESTFTDSGYFVLGDDSVKMIVDCGETGPRYQPGHTHCDTLSYEISLENERLIVDTGTYDYETGPRRQYDRSTAAHNTVRINGEEQSEIWGLFRVARRASPISSTYGVSDTGLIRFTGSHNGYRRLSGVVTHTRDIFFRPGIGWSVNDLLEGKDENKIESFIHIHPRYRLQAHTNRIELLNSKGTLVATIVIHNNCKYDTFKSVYHPEFGKELENKVIRLYAQTKLPFTMGYDINLSNIPAQQ